jgi:DNA polymerase III sliding clamp (beta) subunit (PCNA family)
VSILQALKFVQGAVSKKDYVPELTHFHIHQGRVTGYDGKLSLSAPIPLDLDCCPKAAPFVAAVQACTDTAQLSMTPTGRLSIRSGRFRANVECLTKEFPLVQPDGIPVAIDGNLLPALRTLYAFTADDATRPWAAGVLLDGGTATATNNVVLVECWLGYHFPYRVNLPQFTIREMLRIGEEPIGMQLTATSITLHYTEGRWLHSQLNSSEWPDVAALMANAPQDPSEVPLVPDGLWEALETLKPFLQEQGQVYMTEGVLHTAREDGASVEVEGVPECVYGHRMLTMLAGVATRLGLERWPAPAPFYGERLRGFVAGMRA